MNSLLVNIFGKLLAAFGFYSLGRKSQQANELKRDVETGKKVNEILEEQRDNRISSVDDSDRMWREREDD